MEKVPFCAGEIPAVGEAQLLGEFLDISGVTDDQRLRGDILGDEGTRGDKATPADPDPGENGNASADDDIVFDGGTLNVGHLGIPRGEPVIEKGGAGSDKDIVAESGGGRQVDAGHEADTVTEGDPTLEDDVMKNAAMVAAFDLSPDDGVVAGLEVISELDIGIEDGAPADNRLFSDPGYTGIFSVGMADGGAVFDDGAFADFSIWVGHDFFWGLGVGGMEAAWGGLLG